MGNKKRKVVLFTSYNYKEAIEEIIRGTDYEFLIVLYFDGNNDKNMRLLSDVYRYFTTKKKNFYLKNVLIISSKHYVANDLRVRGIITPKDITNFRYDKFTKIYETFDLGIDEFVSKFAQELEYSFDLYETKNPWIYSQNNTNIMSLTCDTQHRILDDYHKLKYTYPDVIFSIFPKRDNSDLIGILKLIGADASIIFTFINDFAVEYSKRSDVFIHIEDEEFEMLGKEFLDEIFDHLEYPNGVDTLRKFFDIPEKNFEADMTYDEEREINKKPQKYYSLKVEKSPSLKTELNIENDELRFNLGLLNKLFVLKKI